MMDLKKLNMSIDYSHGMWSTLQIDSKILKSVWRTKN